MIKFEKVSKYKDVDINLPKRKTKYSAGYDFEVAKDTVIQPMSVLQEKIAETIEPGWVMSLDDIAARTKQQKAKPTLVPTGVKCHLDPNTYLQLSVRSSCPLKYWLVLANGVGIIDADYCDNPDNEGEIFFQIINLGPAPIILRKGDVIGQGIIQEYKLTDDDFAEGLRQGGFGSTDFEKEINEIFHGVFRSPEASQSKH